MSEKITHSSDHNQTRRSRDRRPTTAVEHTGVEHVGAAPTEGPPETPRHTSTTVATCMGYIARGVRWPQPGQVTASD